MRDQASTLRKLVLDTAREEHGTKIRTPRVIAIAGGRRGVGVTTLALNLSTALSERGLRVLLVDTDLHPTEENTSLADYCQIAPVDT
ncbi:MAG: AAA family ATPase, partial [Pirellulales bacterium]|nr:AAA family ATPase [Pirellulales bacterium]